MKQKRKWFLSSATDDTNLTEINFKIELLVDGEPNKDLVDFYDGRLIPQPTEGDTYTKRTNSLVRMLVCDVKDNKVQYMEHKFTNGKN
jgi:hypothetical protein